MKLLFELMKDAKRSDRELAKVLDTSQPSVSRMRNKLVKDGLIKQFTIKPDFLKLGYEILAITCFKSKVSKEFTEKAEKVTMSKPNIIFAAACEGMGKNALVISLHKSYSEYYSLLRDIRSEGGDDIEACEPLLVSLRGLIVKPFSLKYLALLEETSEN